MKTPSSSLAQLVLAAVTVLLLFAFLQTRTIGTAQHNLRMDSNSQFRGLEYTLDVNVLRTSALLLADYDVYVEIDTALHPLIDSLLVQEADADPAIEVAERDYVDLLRQKLEAAELIKSRAALVRNGLSYLPTVVADLHGSSTDLALRLNDLLARLFKANQFFGELEYQSMRADIEALRSSPLLAQDESAAAGGSTDPRAVLKLLGLVLDHVRDLKAAQRDYVSIPSLQALDTLETLYLRQYETQTLWRDRLSLGLLMLTLVSLGGLVLLMRSLSAARQSSDLARLQLRDAVESLHEGFALYDAGRKLVLWNSRYLELYPRLADQLAVGMSYDKAAALISEHLVDDVTVLPGAAQADRSHYLEQTNDGRWLIASDSETNAGELVCVRVDISESKRDEMQLRKLYRALEQSPVSVVITNLDGAIEYVNPQFEQSTGYSEAEVLGNNPRILQSGDKTSEDYAQMWQTLLDGDVWRGEFHNRRKDGSTYWEFASISPVRDESGRLTHFIGVKEDITAKKLIEDQLRMNATVLQTVSEAVMVTDENNRITFVNPAFIRITGYAADEVMGEDPAMLSSGRHDTEFYRDMWHTLNEKGHWSGEVWNRRKDGRVYPEWLSLAINRDAEGRIREHVAVFSDITQRKRDEEHIVRQANYDALTQLPNRTLLSDRIDRAIRNADREGYRVALLFIDLDQFKAVNDSLGHVVGDDLLRQFSGRLSGCVRSSDTVARFGGDEFVVLTQHMGGADGAAMLAEKVLEAVKHPFNLSGKSIVVGASIGVSIYPEDCKDEDTMLRNADIAMYQAKESGRNRYRFFTEAMNTSVRQRSEMEQELRVAIGAGQLELHYQPLISALNQKMVGVEALVRWRHPERGLIPPNLFIPLAETTGLIAPLGSWVLNTACEQAARWQREQMNIKVNVNLSTRQLVLGMTVEEVRNVLLNTGLDAGLLHLEITESMMLENSQDTLRWLRDVRELGVRLAVDDFGTGFASLSYLRRFPVDALKLDREFIEELPDNRKDASMVEGVIAMAQSLGLETVAEGIENERQAEFIRQAGGTLLQGYHFSKPLPADEIPGFYQRYQGA